MEVIGIEQRLGSEPLLDKAIGDAEQRDVIRQVARLDLRSLEALHAGAIGKVNYARTFYYNARGAIGQCAQQ